MLLGKDAAGLSASAIGRLKDGWLDEHTAWQRRDLSTKRYVYIWADGIHLQARLEDEKQCILVLIGATPEGRKELVGFTRWRPRERAGLVRSAARPEATRVFRHGIRTPFSG
jgi:transposase-like protein